MMDVCSRHRPVHTRSAALAGRAIAGSRCLKPFRSRLQRGLHTARAQQPYLAPGSTSSTEEHTTALGEVFHSVRPRSSNAQAARPIQVSSLNHMAVPSWDVKRSAAWYQEVLGFQPLPRPDFLFSGCWLSAGDAVLHIIEADPAAPRAASNWASLVEGQPEPWHLRRARHLAFQVNDMAAAEESLIAHGVPYDRFTVPGSGSAQLFFFDPDHNGIEIGDYRKVQEYLAGQTGKAAQV